MAGHGAVSHWFQRQHASRWAPVELVGAVCAGTVDSALCLQCRLYTGETGTEWELTCRVLQECGLEVDKEAYTMSFTTHPMGPLYAWSLGRSFKEVTEATTIYEGSLIRCTRRLMELMLQLIVAAEKVGDMEMGEKIKASLETIQRGIMFYGSLYL